MPRPRREDGFALPITIFLVTLITLMLAALFARVSADRQVAESSGDMVDALTIAESGLQAYLGTASARPPDGDSVRVNVAGGYADVIAHVLQHPADTMENETFVVRSTGHVIVPTMGATPQASRTVAQFAAWQVGSLHMLAAFTAANGVKIQGSGTLDIRGVDQCGGAAPPLPGLRISNGPSVSSPGITGLPDSVHQVDNAATVATQTRIAWAAAVGDGFIPDYNAVQPGNTTFPSQRVLGNATLTDVTGTGILVVSGDLTLAGSSFVWNGIVLVGGEIHFDAINTAIDGAVVSGLNEQLGAHPPRGVIGRSGTTITIRHFSCMNTLALQRLTGFVPYANAWVDDWAAY